MTCTVFANSREVSCKQSMGNSICEFPDVCFTPPLTPATPPGVPVPYPNTARAADTSNGSSTVVIGGQEVMLKNKSYFKRSMGDEAGCAPKKGIISSVNMGKAYFIAWSMDVKVEGENVVRQLDPTTHNHASPPNGAVPMPHTSMASPGWNSDKCPGEITREKEACQDFDPHSKGKSVCKAAGMSRGVRSYSDAEHAQMAADIQSAPEPADAKTQKEKAQACLRARRCRLVPYSPKDANGTKGCCPSQTPDHLIPKSSFYKDGVSGDNRMAGWKNYSSRKAPCMCAEGPSNHGGGSHPLRHAHHKAFPPKGIGAGDDMPFDDAASHSAKGASEVFKASGCSKGCIEAQLVEQHKAMAHNKNAPSDVKYSPSGSDVSKADVRAEMRGMNTGLAPGGP